MALAMAERRGGGTVFGGLLISAAAIGLAVAAACQTVATIAADKAPTTALSFVSGHPVALANQARAGWALGQSERAEMAALETIRNTATSSNAFQTLGLVRSKGDANEAERLFEYALALSQREVGAQIWLARHLFFDGKWESGLRHLDAAMRVSPASRPTGYSLLASAIAVDEVLEPIFLMLRSDPPWLEGFLAHGIQNPAVLPGLARVVARLPASSPARAPDVDAALVRALIRDGKYREALAYVQTTQPEFAGDELVRDSSFQGLGSSAPLNWTYAMNVELWSEPMGDNQGGLLYHADTGTGGVVATQLIFLEPGDNELMSRGRSLSGDDGEAVWTIECAGALPVMLAQAPMRRHGDHQVAQTKFTIPSEGCGAQWLKLTLHASFSPGGVEGIVEQVRIRSRQEQADQRLR